MVQLKFLFYVTSQDYNHDARRQRLKALLASNVARLISGSNCLDELQADLNLAEVVSQVDMPKDVVTMNSTVTLRDLHTQDIENYTLVYPDHADIANQKLSVLAPIGAAVLGYRVGDEIQWRIPAGWRRLKGRASRSTRASRGVSFMAVACEQLKNGPRSDVSEVEFFRQNLRPA